MRKIAAFFIFNQGLIFTGQESNFESRCSGLTDNCQLLNREGIADNVLGRGLPLPQLAYIYRAGWEAI